MDQHLFLFGGGLPFLPKITKTFCEISKSRTGPITILFLAREGWEDYMEHVIEPLKQHSINDFQYIPLQLTPIHDSVNMLENSSGIIVLGGDTNEYANYIVESPIFHVIKRKVNDGIPYIGFSAGALITPEQCIISPRDNDKREFQVRNGLGLLKQIGFAVHFSEWNDEDHLVEIHKKYPEFEKYGIDEKTGIYFQNGKIKWMEGKGVYQFQENQIKKIYG